MNEKALKTLEYDKILLKLCEEAASIQGKEEALSLKPRFNAEDVKAEAEMTSQAAGVMESKNGSPIHRFEDMRPILSRLKISAALSFKELLFSAVFLQCVREAKNGIFDENASESGIFGLSRLLIPLEDTEKRIFDCIVNDEEMADNASAKLFSLRKQIRRENEGIREKLNSLVRHLDRDGILQEGIVTMRDGRYVLPVLAANKSRVPGIVHGQSASGATLFIEPMAVVEANNLIRRLTLEERDEVRRITEELSRSLSVQYDILESDNRLMCRLDCVFAKARLGRKMNGCIPVINEKGYINIISGRHPLIDEKKAVPISVWLGREFTELLITGPNTGGKTVTLKTIGLFALMAQSGMMLPAEQNSEMPVFDNIFADIGDEQSIEQNLSTFSSHMKNIASIMQEVSEHSLVLFDELGAGTDPAEGAALAMSILEELRRKRIRTVVTSHYAELKVYSLSHAGCKNASVEFDVASLKPTYRLMVGVPGNSNAFLISAKLGLPKQLIDRARSYVDEDSRKLDKVLTNAEEYRASAQKKSNEAQQLKNETDSERILLEREKRDFYASRDKVLQKAEREAEKIRERALEEANKIIEELKRLEEEGNTAALFKARELRKGLKSEKAAAKREEPHKKGEPIKEFLPGMDVYINSLENDGVLISKPNSRGKAQVRIGIIQTEVDASDLTYPTSAASNEKSYASVHRSVTGVPMSLDVRGQLADEAIANTDMYLDMAYGAGLGSVTIIHGKGTGALKSAISAYLRNNRLVKSFRAGAYGEGDAGVTVVEFKK